LDHVDDLFRSQSSHGVMSMKVVSTHYTRELSVEQWTRGKNQSLVRILAPKKERGISTLRVSGEIWNYLPNVDRVVKIPASSMADAWMGSHFSNEDLVKLSRMADDYTYAVSFRGTRDGKNITELTLTPKPGAAVVWGKLLVAVQSADATPLSIAYYAENQSLTRTQSFSNVGPMGDRTLPRTVRMVPADKPTEYTELTYQSMTFDAALEESLFSIRHLKN
jgi:outer membrane lipoprotein-sorting protein